MLQDHLIDILLGMQENSTQFSSNWQHCKVTFGFKYMGLDARKPVFGVLRITQAQTSLRIRAIWSAPLLFAFWKVRYVNLPQVKFQFSSLSLLLSRLVWISLCRKPRRQIFFCQGQNWFYTLFIHVLILANSILQSVPNAYHNSWKTTYAC